MDNKFRMLALGLSLLGTAQLAGCAAAAVGGAAAGGAGALAYSDRGAKSDVKGDPETVRQKAQNVFDRMGIQTTGTSVKDSGKNEELTGKSGDKDITVHLSAGDNAITHVEVIAQESAIKWNKDYAKDLLSQIIQQS